MTDVTPLKNITQLVDMQKVNLGKIDLKLSTIILQHFTMYSTAVIANVCLYRVSLKDVTKMVPQTLKA